MYRASCYCVQCCTCFIGHTLELIQEQILTMLNSVYLMGRCRNAFDV